VEITCQKCGAPGAEGQAFCSKCGAVLGMDREGGSADPSWNMAATMVGQKLPPSPPPRREAAPTLVERPGYQTPQPAAPPAPPPRQQNFQPPAAPQKQAGGNRTLFILLGLLALIALGVIAVVALLILLDA